MSSEIATLEAIITYGMGAAILVALAGLFRQLLTG